MKLTIWITVWILVRKMGRTTPTDLDCDPVVSVEQGRVRGTCMTSLSGDPFYAFRGIRYGKPPVGQLRFQEPQPAEPWEGIYNATKDSNTCPQIFAGGKIGYTGDEDCLNLYVYSHPLSRYNKSLPVLVYIHGGAAIMGSAASFDFKPRRLMSSKSLPIVIVAIQYRLSCLGFLSTGDSVSPGNYGGLDQRLAFRWVQENIRQFGGDPNLVTILGDSAGGLSAITHLVSTTSAGLFRAIATISGSLDLRIEVQTNPLAIARKFGNSVGCRSENTTVLVDCLRRKTPKELVLAAHTLSITTVEAFVWAVVVENPQTAKYLKQHPAKHFSEGSFVKVPIILGTTSDEASTLFLPKYFNFLKHLPMIPLATEFIIFNIFVPFLVHTFLKHSTNLHALSYAIKRKYEKEYNFRDRKQLLQFIIDVSTDAVFKAGTDKLARAFAAQGIPSYLYSFEYHGDVDSPRNFGYKEIGHEENKFYINGDYLNPKDSEMSKILCSHILNFVHHLDPTPGNVQPKWTPTPSARELLYLRYGDDEVAMKEGYFTDKMDFWRTQVPKILSAKRFNGSTVSGLTWL